MSSGLPRAMSAPGWYPSSPTVETFCFKNRNNGSHCLRKDLRRLRDSTRLIGVKHAHTALRTNANGSAFPPLRPPGGELDLVGHLAPH